MTVPAEAPDAATPSATPGRRAAAQARKRQVILDAARVVFGRLGYDGASMNDIAAEAGVSKPTLYVYFADKEGLFAALIEELRAMQPEVAVPLDAGDPDVAGALAAFGERLVARLTSPGHVALVRLVIGAADRFPAIGQRFYEAGPRAGVRLLADYIAAQVRAGRLDAPDPEAAARQFLDLVQGWPVRERLFNVASAPDGAARAAGVAEAVRVFLAAYGVTPPAARPRAPRGARGSAG